MTLTPSRRIETLLDIMAALRTPETGCPWDLEQDFATIAPYTIEEAYEVADAIRRGDMVDLADELGDLLLQVVFHAQMAREQGSFDFGDVVHAITAKMIRRHPHVFGDVARDGAGAVKKRWEDIKAEERALKAARRDGAGGNGQARGAAEPSSVLDGVPYALPALMRAEKLQKRAARVGFDWPDTDQVHDKIAEELAELREAADAEARKEEVGDLLFAVANLARHHGIDPETALGAANDKFDRRFRKVEELLRRDGISPDAASLDEMEAKWIDAKRDEAAKP